MNEREVLARARFNANQKKDLINLIREITRRDGIAEAELWAELEPVLASERTPGQKADAVLELLRARRYPEYSRRLEAIREMKKRLGLNKAGVAVEPPAYFEGERLEFRFEAGSAEELARAARALSDAAASPEAPRLFETLK